MNIFHRLKLASLAGLIIHCLVNSNSSFARDESFYGIMRRSPLSPTKISKNNILAELLPLGGEKSSLAWIRVTAPKLPGGYTVKGSFEEFDIHFFEIKKEKNSMVYGGLVGVPFSQKGGEFPIKLDISAKGVHESVSLPINIEEKPDQDDVEMLNLEEEEVRPNSPDVVKRIVDEEAEADLKYRTVTPNRMWSGLFTLPVRGSISSPFGRYRIYSSHIQRRVHWGVDFRVPVGTPVKASATGKVILAKDLFFSGKTVMLDHGYGLITVYAHLSKIDVKVGDHVQQCSILGKSGVSGKVTGPHVHWQAILNQVKIDPMELWKMNAKYF